jgi:hypothetical protein
MALEICRNLHTFIGCTNESANFCKCIGPYGISLRDSTIDQ